MLDPSTSPVRSASPSQFFCQNSSGASSHSRVPFPFFPLGSVLQAKVTEELAAATAQVSQLQLELTAQQKKEMDLRKQLAAAAQDAERHEAQVSKLQAQLAGLCSMRALLCLFFPSWVFPSFWSIPAFPRISHKGIKEG